MSENSLKFMLNLCKKLDQMKIHHTENERKSKLLLNTIFVEQQKANIFLSNYKSNDRTAYY